MTQYGKSRMAGSTPAIPFWLKVRKEYILENFQEMLEYMQKFPYNPEGDNPDFNDTLESMAELSRDFAAEFMEQPYFVEPRFNVGTDKVAALMGAAVLAYLKKGEQAYDILACLAALLICAYPDLPQGTLAGLWRVLTACVSGRRIHRTTFSWRNVAGAVQPQVLAALVAETAFEPSDNADERFWLENSGLMVVSDGLVILAPLNLTDFRCTRTGTQFIGGLGLASKGMAEIRIKSRDVEKFQSFEESYSGASELLRTFSEFRPSVSKRLKEYADGDVLPAVVVSKTGIKLTVKSVDPDYKPVSGNVYMRLDPDHRPSVDVVRDYIKPGDLVEVTMRRNLNCIFDMSPNLERFYRDLGCSMANRIMGAIYDCPYAAGTQWITEDGLRVGIAQSKADELNDDELDLFDNAMEHGLATALRAYKDEPRKDGVNFYLYAEPAFDYNDKIEQFRRSDADENFADLFLGKCHEDYGHLLEKKDLWTRLPQSSAELLAKTLAVLADEVSRTSSERLDNLLCAAAAAFIAGRRKDYEFLYNEIVYLSRLVDFAKDREIRPLPSNEEINGEADVRRRVRVLELLKGYVRPGLDVSEEAVGYGAGSLSPDLTGRIAKLIEASNSLAGIIRPRELDNIKRTIAATLGVDDEYKSILSDRKWYGDESEQLEFKVSVVFPPLNRRRNNLVADPEGQKWAIIKTVCAFLNSVDGGTLLIGVNDYGFAEGVNADIQELYRTGYISKPDMDRYMNYVMRLLDTAFREQNGGKGGFDITVGRIRYESEESPEGKQILRITVSPYTADVVEISGEVPEGMVQSYVRGSSRSLPLSQSLAAELRASRAKMLRIAE